MSKLFEVEMETFEGLRDYLVSKENERWVLIKGRKLYGIYDTQLEAIKAGVSILGSVSMLTHQILKEDKVWYIY